MKKNHKNLVIRIIFLNIIIFFVVLSCNSSKINPQKNVGKDSVIKLEELYSASNSYIIENETFTPEFYIWRDLMPVLDKENEKGLYLSLKIKFETINPVLEKLKAEKIWIIHQSKIYYLNLSPAKFENELIKEFYFRDGPIIEAGNSVDIVFEINLVNSNYRFIVKGIKINAVY